MKAEERHRLEKNELAEKIMNAWEGVSASTPRANRIWTVVLVGFVALTAGILWSRYSRNSDAALWNQLEFADTSEALKKLASDSPNSAQGRLAKLNLARWQMQEALAKIDAQSPDERVAAADLLESVRASYGELAKSTGLPDVLIQEAMLQDARCEETLASVPKAADASARRGSIDDAIRKYSAVASRYPKSFAGVEAARRAEKLKSSRAEIDKLYGDLARDQAKTPTPVDPSTPTLPAP
jgi:hypothetical protein